MKSLFHVALFCFAAALICGCATRHNEPVYHAGDENPPDFLVGPTMVVLTNLNGFSAHVTCSVSSPGEPPRTTSGELLGREGLLVFQPTLAIKGKRARLEGGLFFIWDETRHSGYVMSEALQGYAPVKSQIGPAAQLAIAKDGVTEDVNGHPCHRCQALVTFLNGSQTHLTLWEADDAGHFPVRIETIEGPGRMTLDFAEIRLETPPQEVFMPPDGFTPYASSIALMNELIVRDANFAKKHQLDESGEPVDQTGNFHPMPGGSGMAHP